jgi:hypothetical protein
LPSKSDAEMKEFIFAVLFYYNQAQYSCVDGKTVEQTVLDITAILA